VGARSATASHLLMLPPALAQARADTLCSATPIMKPPARASRCFEAMLTLLVGRAIGRPMKLIAIIVLLLPVTAWAQPLPVPRQAGPGGACPIDYAWSGSHCTPLSDRSAPEASCVDSVRSSPPGSGAVFSRMP
jgi:hypothetical protein